MHYHEEHDATLFETRDGEKYWAEDGANYIEGAGTVVLNCLDSDGEQTSDSFTKMEALGLAIELARAAGLDRPALLLMSDGLHRMRVKGKLKGFSLQERANINLVCIGLFGIQLTDRRMTEELVEAVINVYREEEKS